MVLPRSDAQLPEDAFTPEELAQLDRVYATDPVAFAEDLLWIRPKSGGQLVPLRLNPGQQKLMAAIRRQQEAGKPVRIIVLKARQIGFSTTIQGFNCYYTTRTHQVSSLIIAHESEGSKNLFRMFLRYVDNLRPEFRPMVKTRNESLGIIEFDNPDPKARLQHPGLGSRVQVETAEDPQAGRSGTYQFVHASEVAFWPHPETFTALLQAVPNEPGTVLILESTANGAQGSFHEMWKAAERGESDFEPVFVAWWEHGEYRLATTREEDETWARVRAQVDAGGRPDPGDVDFLKLDAKEVELARLYPVDYCQLKWRRWAVTNLCEGDHDRFKQEYPSSPDEAFLVTGRPWFHTPTVIALKEELRREPPATRYHLDEVESERQRRPVLRPDPFGEVWVWKLPEKGKRYVIGADVVEGQEDGNFDAAEVLEVESLEHVAELHGRMDPDLYGRKLHWLGIWYNRALLGPEANSMGVATVNVLEKYTRYPNLWGEGWPHRQKIREYGWKTTIKTRPVILGKIKQAVREKVLQPRSPGLLDEMLVFKVNAKGKPEAQHGKQDDRVLAMAIALELREHVARVTGLIHVKSAVTLGGTGRTAPRPRVIPKHPRW